MTAAEFAADFAAGLAVSLAEKALAAGAGRLNRWTRGSDEERALQQCFESAFAHMLAGLGVTEETQQQVCTAFEHALSNTAAAEALLQTALAPHPSPDALSAPLRRAGFDGETLPVNADNAVSLLVEGLEAALRREAAAANSPLFNRVQLSVLYALRLTLAQIAGALLRPASRPISLGNFFDYYMGQPDRPAPFGGRAADIAALNRWLGDPAACDRMLLTAPAGRGKSALLASRNGHARFRQKVMLW